jgi:hypothetical protein
MTAVPNKDGVLVGASNATIGGVTGTSASACTGDCNLIAGNTHAQITGTTTTSSDGGITFASLKIEGNWIGMSAGGESALSAPAQSEPTSSLARGGILLDASNGRDTLPISDGDGVVIGGDTSRPGLAPGNVITSSFSGVYVSHFYTKSLKTNPAVRILGNLIGLSADGEHASGKGAFGLETAKTDASVGDGTNQGVNVISGFKYGVAADGGDDLNFNFIGTNVSGTSAVGNYIGLTGTAGYTDNNVISGNNIGVKSTLGAVLGCGNLVGLTPSGLTALPNKIGIEAPIVIVGAPKWGHASTTCPSTPADVISGNSVAGISDDKLTDLWLDGTYVGTDITGTRAVPNGVGLDFGETGVVDPSLLDLVVKNLGSLWSADYDPLEGRIGSQPILEIGGPSAASTGTCAYPCNIIAGNKGLGLRLNNNSGGSNAVNPADQESYIAGNYFGLSASGEALPNGGPDLTISGVEEANPLRIGGKAAEGNVFNGIGSPAISVSGSTSENKTAPVAIKANIFEMSGGAKPIALPRFSVSPPRLSDITQVGSNVEIRGQISARAFFGHDQTLELYGTPSCTGTLSPVAQFMISNQSGNFDVSVAVSNLTSDRLISALVTDGDGYTSRFAALDPLPGSAALGC